MHPKPLILAACMLLFCVSLKAQFAPDSLQGVMLHSVVTSAPPFPYNQTIGKTTVGIMAISGTTYSTYLEGNNEVIQTGVSYSYTKQSPNVGAFTVWIPSLSQYVTTLYTFTSPDTGTVYSSASIGIVRGTFKMYKMWSWQDQVNYWDQAITAQNDYILEDPSSLGLYNQGQLNAAVAQAKDGLYTQAQLDQAILDAKTGLYTQEQLDAAVDASQPNVYFRSSDGWTLSDNLEPLFMLTIKRSTDLTSWQTAGQAEVKFTGDGEPAFIKIEVE